MKHLLVDPVMLSLLVRDELFWLEPEGNFLLSRLDGVRTVADIAAHILYRIGQWHYIELERSIHVILTIA